jgi:hypothetical protein
LPFEQNLQRYTMVDHITAGGGEVRMKQRLKVGGGGTI